MLRLVTKRPRRLLSVLIGPVLLAAILWQTDLQALGTLLEAARPAMILAAIPLVFAFHLLKAWRWKAILRGQAISMKFMECYWIYGAGLLLGLVTPGRLGDFSKIWYLRKLGYSYGRSAVSVFLDRLLDLVLMAFVALVAVVWYARETGLTFSLYVIVLLTVLVPIVSAVLLAFVTSPLTGRLGIGYLARRWLPSRWMEEFGGFRRDWNAIPLTVWVRVSAMSVGGWVVYWSAVFVLVKAMSLPMSYWEATAFYALSSIAGYLPVSVAGIGTREALLVILFSQIGLSWEEALAFSFAILFINVETAFEGLVGYVVRPLPTGDERHSQ